MRVIAGAIGFSGLLAACTAPESAFERVSEAAPRALLGGRVPSEAEFASSIVFRSGCTGAKVGRFKFLTASHCVTQNDGTMRSVFVPGAALDISSDNDRRRWRRLTVAETQLPTPYYYTFGPSDYAIPLPPDAALVTFAEETPGIPIAVVDTVPVEAGDPVVKCGYGSCEKDPNAPFTVHATTAAPAQAYLQYSPRPAQHVLPSSSPTYKKTLDPSTAELCGGDSGGPLYRDLPSELLVVGVNHAGERNFDLHTRFDVDSYYGVGSWLASVGARVRFPIDVSPYGGTAVPVTGTIEAENFDVGVNGVAYQDTTPGNQGGAYRAGDSDVFARSNADNGHFVRAAPGEWLRYEITADAGDGAGYSLELRVADSAVSGPALRIELDGEESLGAVQVPALTPSVWHTLTVPHVSLSPGRNRLRLLFERALSVDSMRFVPTPSQCEDGVVSGDETAVDCGGVVCSPCAAERTCAQNQDCTSKECRASRCARLVPAVVETGSNFACGRFSDGSVRCWGRNDSGQLGVASQGPIGDEPSELATALQAVPLAGAVTALALGSGHACVILAAGAVQCWGSNGSGQLGLGDTVNRSAPATVDLGGAAVELALGGAYSCARMANGSVKCWGSNALGQLGIGSNATIGDEPGEMGAALTAVRLPGAASSIAAGSSHACALLANREVRCWGSAFHGQLGYGFSVGGAYGDSSNELTPQVAVLGSFLAAQISAGATHTCARSLGGQVKCWGQNAYGQLGLGDAVSRGNSAAQMGDNLPAVPLPATSTLIARGNSTCAQEGVNSRLRCWGYSGARLGQPELAALGHIGDQPNEIASLPPIDFGASSISAGGVAVSGSAGCVLLANSAVKCWGTNDYGELGLGDTAARGDQIGEMGDALPPLLFP